MSTLPSRRISHAIAWLLLAMAVAGVVRIAGRPDVSSPKDPVVQNRSGKSRERDIRQVDQTLSPEENVLALMARRPGAERDQALHQAVGAWADENPDATLAWIKRLPPGEERDWLACAALTSIANVDPQQAAELLDLEIPPGQARNHALVAIAQRWVQLAPEDAESWLESLANSPARDDALREVGIISFALSTHSSE
jgi:hypothetical protein